MFGKIKALYSKIFNKVGYTIPLVITGALLPLAIWGLSSGMFFILGHIGFLSVFLHTGLVWGTIWPLMVALSGFGLLIGLIIDIGSAIKNQISKIIQIKKTKKIKINKNKDNNKNIEQNVKKQKSKSKNNLKNASLIKNKVVLPKKFPKKNISSNNKRKNIKNNSKYIGYNNFKKINANNRVSKKNLYKELRFNYKNNNKKLCYNKNNSPLNVSSYYKKINNKNIISC